MAGQSFDQAIEQMRNQQGASAFDKLNPDVSGVAAPQFLNYSKTPEMQSGIGDLFKNLGQTAATAVEGVDKFFKERIRGEATEAVDTERRNTTRQLLGGGGAQDMPAGISNAIGSQMKGLGVLKTAAENGSITPAYYQMNLDSIAKDLRSRYPGYREHIDNVISDLTGGTPANKVIADLFHANTGKGDKEEALRYHLIQELTDTDHTNKLGSYVKENGNYPSNMQMIQWVSELKGRRFAVQAADADIKLKEAQGKLTEDESNRWATSKLADLHAQALTAGGGLFSDNEKLQKGIGDMTKSVEAGQPISSQQVQSMTVALQQMESKATAIRNQVLNDPSAQKMTATQKEALIKWHKDVIDDLHSSLGKDGKLNLGVLSWNGNFLKVLSEGDQAQILRASEASRWLHSFKSLYGDNALNGMLGQMQGGKILSGVLTLNQKMSLSKIGLGESDLTTEIKKAHDEGTKDPNYYAGLVEGTKKMILDPEMTKAAPDKIDAIARSLYNGNKSLFAATASDGKTPLIDPKEHKGIFSNLTSPEMTNRFFQLKEQGKPELWDNYKKWVRDEGMLLAKKDITDAAALTGQSSNPSKLIWDPKTSMFAVENKIDARPSIANANLRDMTDAARNQLNKSIAPFVQTMKLDGATPEQITQKIQEMVGFGGLKMKDMLPGKEGEKPNPLEPRSLDFGQVRGSSLPKELTTRIPEFTTRVQPVETGSLSMSDEAAKAQGFQGDHFRITSHAGQYHIVPSNVKDADVAKFLKSNIPGIKGFDDLQRAQALLKRLEEDYPSFMEKNSFGRRGK